MRIYALIVLTCAAALGGNSGASTDAPSYVSLPVAEAFTGWTVFSIRDGRTAPPEAQGLFTESISRAWSILNRSSVSGPFTEAISRSLTVLNGAAAPSQFTEAISRAWTVSNQSAGPLLATEAVSRAWTIFATGDGGMVFTESISRAHTVQNE